jgi:glycosyltransferase involved in cell wall biosynthesis
MSLNQVAGDRQPASRSQTGVDRRVSSDPLDSRLDVHVVILNNVVRTHHVACYRELAKRVRKLTVLLSVSVEPDRAWGSDWGELNVVIQKNWTWKSRYTHRTGFQETNFIHIPIDTISRLKSLKPDIVFSYEMGMRTLLSSCYRRFHRNVPLIMVGNMAEHIERDRGLVRRCFRRLINWGVDYFTYNGPSCRRYLESLSIVDQRLFHLPYCIDPESVYRGERKRLEDSSASPRRLFYAGVISERKGILEFATALKRWCQANPRRQIELMVAGTGPLQEQVARCSEDNLAIEFLGNCDSKGLQDAYRCADVCVFPSLGDEWGLVPIEAMASGVPVIGSIYAQSVETVVQEGHNGWVFDPIDSPSIEDAIDRAMQCSRRELEAMGMRAKASVAHISALASAEKFMEIITNVLPKKC